MLLASHGSSVELRPLRFQFSHPTGSSWDDNWLVIEGRVRTPAGHWSFQEPVLLVSEAQDVGGWLRSVVQGRVAVTGPDEDGGLSPSLDFLEPNVAFSLAARSIGRSVVRVHLSLESAPPWLDRDDLDLHQYAVELELGDRELLAAADTWTQELAPFPPRRLSPT
ncbi:hypothetical protein ACFW1A_06370 [Kitasatospora sp. NPDC058965]|uniref:WapI family immunity protein n=1 Tax=Kitasatospora sp. NPDC058965 TaxID=3346682 RepID=UPI00367971BF